MSDILGGAFGIPLSGDSKDSDWGGGWCAIIPGPRTVAAVPCEHEDSGGGHFLHGHRCRINVLGLGPAAEAEAWREAQGPSSPATLTAVTFEIWNQLKMVASAMTRGRTWDRGEGTPWVCCKVTSIAVF